MLVLSRKVGESILLADNIELHIVAIDGQRVRIGIKAPKEVRVVRAELAGTGPTAPAEAVTTPEVSKP